MDLRYVVKVMLRHWVIVPLTLVATGIAAVMLAGRVQPDYQADTSVVLLSPSSIQGPEGEEVQVNPYTRFGSTERVTATALVNVVLGQEFARELEEAGVTGTYSVFINPSAGGAILDLRVTTDSPDRTLRELAVLRERLQAELAERQEQAGAPARTWIRTDVLAAPLEATPLSGSKTRVILAVVLLGGGAAVSLAFIAESLSSRARRKDTSGPPTSEVGSVPPPEPEGVYHPLPSLPRR